MSAIHFSDVHRARLQLQALVLPRPERVLESAAPAGRVDALESRPDLESGILVESGRASVGCALDSIELRSLIRSSLAHWATAFVAPAAEQAWAASPGEDPHDGYFRIERAEPSPGPHYLRAVVGGLDLFLQEAASPCELRDYEVIGIAMLDLWCAAVGESPQWARASPPAEMRQRAPDPVRRWVRGHQIFAVITQGLIWTLHRFEHASAGDDERGLREALQRMARLYRASAAAFRFTADFDPAFYEHAIRPSMSEPHLPAGFSGTMSSDHGHLVSLLKTLRMPLADARLRCPSEYADMTAALAQVYDDHKWVCARFTGASATSLLTGSLGGDRSATDMLDRFKARRVGNLLS